MHTHAKAAARATAPVTRPRRQARDDNVKLLVLEREVELVLIRHVPEQHLGATQVAQYVALAVLRADARLAASHGSHLEAMRHELLRGGGGASAGEGG